MLSKPKNIIKVSDIKFRKKWRISPITKIHKSDKEPTRSQEKLTWKSDWEDIEDLDEYDMDGC